MRRLLPALLCVLLGAPHALAAQDATHDPFLTPGSRVRVTYAGEDARIGTLIALAPDTLAVEWANGGGTSRLARSRVTRVDVSRGIQPGKRASRAKLGFYIGGGIGLAIGALSASSNSQCAGSDDCDDVVNGLATVMGAAMLGGVGAVVGAISGQASEKWVNARLEPERVGLVFPARGRGKSVGLALAF